MNTAREGDSHSSQVSSAKIKVEGDVYTQVGLDNPFTETWRRVPPSELAK